jgi:hypothetical protein
MSAIRYQKELIEFYCNKLPDMLPADASEELQTMCAIAIELMKTSTPSKLREAARNVELRHYIRRVGSE